jgi:adenylate kinase family enzyme
VKPFRIILEGPDNAGKTTLARRLCDATGAAYFHAGGPPKNVAAEDECMRQQGEWLSHDGLVVVDRVTGISQVVYNPDPKRDRIRRMWIRSLLSSQPSVLLVYCRPPNDWLMASDRYTWRPEETEEHKQKIIRNAMTFIERYDDEVQVLPKVVYDFRSAAAEGVFNTLHKAMMDEDGYRNFVVNMAHYKIKA